MQAPTPTTVTPEANIKPTGKLDLRDPNTSDSITAAVFLIAMTGYTLIQSLIQWITTL